MRIIKFRAWDKITKTIHEVLSIDYETELIKGLIDVGRGKNTNFQFIQFNEVELMQFTGRKDKNGKEIYEGDIVKIDKIGIRKIVFNHGSFCSHIISSRDKDLFFHLSDTSYYEVIGNIYENPELLEEK